MGDHQSHVRLFPDIAQSEAAGQTPRLSPPPLEGEGWACPERREGMGVKIAGRDAPGQL